MYNFDKSFDRHNTEVIKWDRLESDFGHSDLIPLGIADMDFETLPEIRDAMIKRAEHPTYGYTFASQKYYDNFIAWNKRRNGIDIKKEEIISIPGIVCANAFILYALTEPGDKVLLTTPVYDPFFKVIEQQKRTLVTSSLKKGEDGYVFDYEDLDKKMADGVKLLVLCNPHNPVGRVWTHEELLKIDALCQKHGVLVFSDDIHSDIVMPGHKYCPFVSVSEDAAMRTVTAMAPSKTFNVAGIKTSVLFANNQEIFKKINDAVTNFHIGVNLFGLKAFETAYGNGDAYVDELCAYLKGNAEYVTDFVAANLPKIKTYVPEGTYLMWLDCTAYGLSQEELMKKAVEAGIAPNDGSHYGKEGEGFLRINIGTQRAMLETAMKQLQHTFA